MVSIFELFKDNIEWLLPFVTFIIGISSGFFTFISSRTLERQFFSKEKRILYQFIIIFSFFIIVPTSLFFYLFSEYEKIELLFKNLFGYFLLILIISWLLIISIKISILIIRKKWFKKFCKIRLDSLISNHKYLLILNVSLNILSSILAMIVYGSLNASLLIDTQTTDIKVIIAGIILLLMFELYFIYIFLIFVGKLKFTNLLLVSIKLDTGEELENYYIYYLSGKSFIIIGKHKDPDLCKEPKLLNVDKIVYCKQVTPTA